MFKIKLPVFKYDDVSIDEEQVMRLITGEEPSIPIENYPVGEIIFYEVTSISSYEGKYSSLVSGGTEYFINMPIKKLEKIVDEAKSRSYLKFMSS